MSDHHTSPSTWSIRHPIGVIMLTLAVVVLGIVAFLQLRIDLLPHIIYPEVRVRVMDPGVPASIMEDQVTRQLEEQLAITEDAIYVQSTTTEGRSSVDLSFAYSKDIDIALRDASTRLDRAKRFLPDTIDPPTIYKRDPFQLPVMEILVSSSLRSPVEVREWTDYSLGPSLLNLPGVAAAEIGGGLKREIQIIIDPHKLESMKFDVIKLTDEIARNNQDTPAGRLQSRVEEIAGRTVGSYQTVDEIRELEIGSTSDGKTIHLADVAKVLDTAEEQRLIVRSNGRPGIKLSIQKQPGANTIEVVDAVEARLQEMRQQSLFPDDISVEPVTDQAGPIRNAINNATAAALGGATLAMLVVYLFLGSLLRTLIVGTAIPVATLITFALMSAAGLNMNIMTLGGLALGIGMLVDSTIVMLENIHRHQMMKSTASEAATEVTSAIIASTSTNLAAVVPFFFLSGLIGLIFRELIFTITAAVIASMVVALTLVPALAGRFTKAEENHSLLQRPLNALTGLYRSGLKKLLHLPTTLKLVLLGGMVVLLVYLMQPFGQLPSNLLPRMDEGLVRISLTSDSGTSITEMERMTSQSEEIVASMPGVQSIFTTVGGFVFGRSSYENANRTSIQVQLVPKGQRDLSAGEWVKQFKKKFASEQIPGLQMRAFVRAIRGLRISQGEDDLSLKIRGPDIDTLNDIGNRLVDELKEVDGLTNVRHSGEETTREMLIGIDRDKAARAGLDSTTIGDAVRIAMDGKTVTTLYDRDRGIDVVVRMDREQWRSPSDVANIQLLAGDNIIRLGDVATIRIEAAPGSIRRDRQQRAVEVNASLSEELSLEQAIRQALTISEKVETPEGYSIAEAGSLQALQEGQALGTILLALALFLVLVVMAVQFESLRNPLVIMFGVPFSGIGVVIGLWLWGIDITMPVWIGMIMLAGIVVNNAIVLVTTIENRRNKGMQRDDAIIEAAGLRLKPILMATLTTVVGMMPLALAYGSGSEMLKPLAVVLVTGLLFSTLISLILVPLLYKHIGNQ
ncbi:efflux RND transporter permease subunit [Solemya velum gill symbiont]|uniref:efflux RND transporter permease subunit n=1 Tax=Solemya velum gill symbiont TaxID=2340 RepID=UPI0021192FDB|nr:efflux RND transporter permease subunit [Solemya velum gill symbiont]